MTDTCKTCGKPIYWVSHLQLWYHEHSTDMLTCPAAVVEPALSDLARFTDADLNRLIRVNVADRTATHNQMMGPDGRARIFPLSPEWDILSARYDELAGLSIALYDELVRRARPAERCDCRTMADQGGEPRFWDCPVHHA